MILEVTVIFENQVLSAVILYRSKIVDL